MATDDEDDDIGCLNQRILVDDAGRVWTPASVRFHTKSVLRAVVFLVFAGLLAVTIVLGVNDAYNMKMFTLWSWTITLAFVFVLLVALWIQHLLLVYTLILLFPFVLANVVFVAIAIIVIIANDSTVLTNNTPCQTPQPTDPKYTVSQVHTGDWIEHGGPPFALFLILLAGGLALMRYVLVRVLDSMHPVLQWLYFAYWMSASLVLLGIYDLAFDVAATYPTSFTTAERVLILLAIVWVWQLLTWVMFTSQDVPGDIHIQWPATFTEFASTGHLHGSGTPSQRHVRVLVPTLEEQLGLRDGIVHFDL